VVMVCAGATHSQRRLQSKRHVECHKNHQTISASRRCRELRVMFVLSNFAPLALGSGVACGPLACAHAAACDAV